MEKTEIKKLIKKEGINLKDLKTMGSILTSRKTELQKLIKKENLSAQDLKIMNKIIMYETIKPDAEEVFNLITNNFSMRDVSVKEMTNFLESENIKMTSCALGLILKPYYGQSTKKINGKTTRLYFIG